LPRTAWKVVKISLFFASEKSTMANHDVMTWMPRPEDYEVQVQVQPDETLEEKVTNTILVRIVNEK